MLRSLVDSTQTVNQRALYQIPPSRSTTQIFASFSPSCIWGCQHHLRVMLCRNKKNAVLTTSWPLNKWYIFCFVFFSLCLTSSFVQYYWRTNSFFLPSMLSQAAALHSRLKQNSQGKLLHILENMLTFNKTKQNPYPVCICGSEIW